MLTRRGLFRRAAALVAAPTIAIAVHEMDSTRTGNGGDVEIGGGNGTSFGRDVGRIDLVNIGTRTIVLHPIAQE